MDPDNFTFWFTSDYFSSNNFWATRVAAFRLFGPFINDVGVSAIISPVNGNLTSSESVEISIRNYSPDPITDIPVELRLDGNLISSFHDRGNTQATIEHFTKVRSFYHENIPLAFLIDNASWHKTLAVKEYCENNNITLLFLPPYAPEYNPIERVWSFLKGKIKQRFFKTADIFREFVFDLFSEINNTHLEELAKQCCSLI
jgi:transposase